MKLTMTDVEYVANLARLALTDAEKEKMTEELSSILAYIDKLSQLDTQDVEPLAHVFPVTNVFREDVCRESIAIEEALRNAPDSEERFFKVPGILD